MYVSAVLGTLRACILMLVSTGCCTKLGESRSNFTLIGDIVIVLLIFGNSPLLLANALKSFSFVIFVERCCGLIARLIVRLPNDNTFSDDIGINSMSAGISCGIDLPTAFSSRRIISISGNLESESLSLRLSVFEMNW